MNMMKDSKEKGAVMVEATIYYPVVILVIGVIIVVSLMKLQQCLIVALLTGTTDMVAVEAMEKENIEDILSTSDNLVSTFSIVDVNSNLMNAERTGSMMQTVNVKLNYKISTPGFVKALFRGTTVESNWVYSISVADVTTLSIDPRYVVDNMDQHILFRCNGRSFGNLMMGKYGLGFYNYICNQY